MEVGGMAGRGRARDAAAALGAKPAAWRMVTPRAAYSRADGSASCAGTVTAGAVGCWDDAESLGFGGEPARCVRPTRDAGRRS